MTTPLSPLAPFGDGLACGIARRAVDLARDGSASVDDVTEHLQRLARGRRQTLEDALAELPPAPDATADVLCARLLVRQAIDALPAS